MFYEKAGLSRLEKMEYQGPGMPSHLKQLKNTGAQDREPWEMVNKSDEIYNGYWLLSIEGFWATTKGGETQGELTKFLLDQKELDSGKAKAICSV